MKNMNKLLISYLFITILLVSNLYFIVKNSNLQKEILEIRRPIEIQKINGKVLNFTKFFIEKVLKTEGEVDFDTRLKLETAVRDLDDEEILAQWQRFVDSKSEKEAQQEVKNLLELLVSKIRVD